MTSGRLAAWKPSVAQWDRCAAAHLLDRAGFGAAPGDIDRLVAARYETALASVFAEAGHDSALVRGIEPLLATAEVRPLQSWWMALVLGGGAPLRERAALMWHDHFATSFEKVADVRLMHAQNRLFRERGLGDFRELLHAIARDPAMLVWLDGDENKKGHPNENFAREIFELFALGIGHYSEADVREAARAFTGWGTSGRSFAERAADHDDAIKTVFGKSSAFRGDDIVDIVIAHPACARRIARRVLEEFVGPEPAADDVETVALVLVDRNWNLRATIESLLCSELFFAPSNRRSRIAGPVELVVRSARALGARVSPEDAVAAAGQMGQTLFRPPSVKGWDGGRTWIHAGAWIARHNWLAGLAAAHGAKNERLRVDLERSLGTPKTPSEAAELAVRGLIPALAGSSYEERVRAAVGPSDAAIEALKLATALVLTSPEYQMV